MDVALIHWPADEALRQELAEQRRTRLLLVDAEAAPPFCVDVFEDWVRLPVSMADRRARIRALAARMERRAPSKPALSRDGVLEFQGSHAQLTAVQAELMQLLIERWGAVASRAALSSAAWPDADPSENNLDVAVTRLRRQIAPVGLKLQTVRSRGYLLAPVTDVA